jgi:hypothetical protein
MEMIINIKTIEYHTHTHTYTRARAPTHPATQPSLVHDAGGLLEVL